MDNFLFIAFPYVAVILAVGYGIYRNARVRFTYSTLSSQLLENRKLFWGSIPWHYGITFVLLAHLIPFIFPGFFRFVLSDPTRLVIFELIGLAFSFATAFGLIVLIVRRLPGISRAQAVTSWMDAFILLLFAEQIASGIGIALSDRWGSLWFLGSVVPWLRSLVLLHPDISRVIVLPYYIRVHILFGFLLILVFPFTRLVHIFTIPLEYLRRPYQKVVWYRDPRRRAKAGVYGE